MIYSTSIKKLILKYYFKMLIYYKKYTSMIIKKYNK